MIEGVLFDEADGELLERHRWYIGNHGYAASKGYGVGQKGILMHRLLLGAVKGQIVDHINCNKLDNRRANLRFCTVSQNSMNRYSRIGLHKGVRWDHTRWTAAVYANRRRVWYDSFDSYEDAVAARQAVILKYHGEFARPI